MQRFGRTWVAAVVALVAAAPALAQQAEVEVRQFTLDNGMEFLVVERDDAPSVSAAWVAHVGSANETYGITGIAHLFEHMMFKGTSTIGTTDPVAERAIMAELDEIRAEMEEEYAVLRQRKLEGELTGSIYSPDNATERLTELRERMRELQERQRELIVKDEFDQIYTAAGASGMNAGTTNDLTFYFVTLPSNKLELWFWMESERLEDPFFREFYSERDVVREERRMRVESRPTAKFEEQFDAMFWTSHPYHHPVIGWPSDVESIGRAEADLFFDTYYAPNNLTGVVVGDVELEDVKALAEQYFGRLERGDVPPPPVVTEEIEQLAERRMQAEADTNPLVKVRWHGVPFVHPDQFALQVAADVLSGRTGRLYERMVEEADLATGEPYAFASSMKYGGWFEVGAEVADEAVHAAVERALLDEVERLQEEPVAERELQKVKNQALADSYRRLQSRFFLMLQLAYYDGLGDWEYLNDAAAAIQAVTAEDVQRVANAYLTEDGRNVLWYRRTAGTAADPELAALPGQAQAMAKQMLAQLTQLDDAAQLGQVIAQMEGSLGQVPEELQTAVELVIHRAKERLAELEAAAGDGEEE